MNIAVKLTREMGNDCLNTIVYEDSKYYNGSWDKTHDILKKQKYNRGTL